MTDLDRFRRFLAFDAMVAGGMALAPWESVPAPGPVRLLRRALLDGSSPGTFEVPAPDGTRLATEHGYDLALRTGDDIRTLTDDGSEERPWVVDNLRWAPDGGRVAALRYDHRGVDRLPIVDWLDTSQTVTWHHYTRAGGPMTQTELWIVDVASGRRRRAEVTTARDTYVFPLRWRAKGAELLTVIWGRTWRWVRLLATHAETGVTRLVHEETSPTNVAGFGAVGGPLSIAHVSPSGDLVASISERDGTARLWLRSVDVGEARVLTPDEVVVRAVAGIDEERATVFFTANLYAGRPYDTHVCSVGFDGGGFTVLTDEPGRHAPRFDPACDQFVDTHSSATRPRRTELRGRDGHVIRVLAEDDTSALHAEGWTPPEPFVADAADGTTPLHGVLYRPPDFDPTCSYPVVEVIYGGPQLAVHPRDFDQGRFGRVALALAQLGFVTFLVDGRGTPERTKAFQDVGHGAFGAHVVADHTAVIGQLGARYPFMDLDRVGITGWSWGGYMTVRAMLTAPEIYRVGVGGCPVYDGEDHLGMAIEPYMGLPADNPDGYAAMSLVPLAEKLTGKLLLIHGTSDTNAPFSATMRMVDAFARADRPVDLLVLPGESHSFTGPLGRYHDDQRARYFLEHLAGAEGE